MKKTLTNFQRLSSPDKKLIKRNKLLTEPSSPQLSLKKKIKVEIILPNCSILTIKFGKDKPLKEVKQKIIHKLRSSKENLSNLVGFQTYNSNFAFDYKFQQQIGNLNKDIKLKCLFFQPDRYLTGLEKYKICCCLAIGGFSKVFLMRSKLNGKFFAGKFIDKNKKQTLNCCLLQNQREISQRLNYQFLVKTHEFIENEEFFIFIMDYCPGGELFYLLKQIKRMSEDQARICFIQILLGIQYLHNSGYMYRDLKPENILMDAHGYIKIADFGLAKPYREKSYSFCGSLQYMAPQIIQGSGHRHFVDFYCLGAILYQMLVGHPPFFDSQASHEQTKARILFDKVQFPKYFEMSDSVKDFISKLTAKNQKQRLGYFGGCKQIMAHPWIGKINRKIYQEKQFLPPFKINLDRMNFDPQQIGQSERNFEKKIRSMEKNMFNYASQQNHMIKPQVKTRSRNHHSLTKVNKSPYRNHKVGRISTSVDKAQKSPYESILRNTRSSKTFKNPQIPQLFSKKYLNNLRWTQSELKQNKQTYVVSKLKKKCKYGPFKTITQINADNSREKSELFKKKHNVYSPSGTKENVMK